MTVVLDTNVFLPICAGIDEPNRVYAKIIRDCDPVAYDSRVIEEYINVLIKEGFNTVVVQVRLQDLHVRQKLRDVTKRVRPLHDMIVTHEKDRHIIECAFAAGAIIVTYEHKHLVDIRNRIRAINAVQIVTPAEYLAMSIQ